MGDRSPVINRIRGYLRRYQPGASSLLELGCGTGAVLAGLAGGLRVTGVDRSPEMLAAAAARHIPGARLVRADMTDFALGTRFDVVICVFDTLNHLPAFDAWQAMFARVQRTARPSSTAGSARRPGTRRAPGRSGRRRCSPARGARAPAAARVSR